MTIVDTGLAEVANLIIGSGTAFDNIAIGTGITGAVVGDTALETEVQRETATLSRVTTNTANDTSQWVNTFAFTGDVAVTEYGILNAASAGVLLLRIVDSAVNVASGDNLQITIKLVGDQA